MRAAGAGEGWAKLAGGQVSQCAEAGGEFGGGDTALTVEAAEEVGGGLVAFVGIAVEAAGDEIAIGIAAGVGAGHDVVDVLGAPLEARQTIEAQTAVAAVNGFAERTRGKEVEFFEVHRCEQMAPAGVPKTRPRDMRAGERGRLGRGSAHPVWSANLIGARHFDVVTEAGALEQADGALVGEATEYLAGGTVADASTASKRVDGETEARLAFDEGVTKKVGVDGALDMREAKSGNEMIFELLPEKCGVEWFVVHGGVLMAEGRGAPSAGIDPFGWIGRMRNAEKGTTETAGETGCSGVARAAELKDGS